ncbi:MAG: DUF4097 family beta strand repeat protein [Lachnospiraceae bacterium]|nr:DUF4097 family beta strand repeat protein [Lachnospiraceae bacterium]
MRERTKIMLSIATFFLGAGLIVFVVMMSANGWDFSKLNTVIHTEDTHTFTEEFHTISLDTNSGDVTILPSENGTCTVVCKYPEKWSHSAAVEDGVLKVYLEDTTSWFNNIHIGIAITDPEISIYLPEKTYKLLLADVSSGNIKVMKGISLTDIDITTDSGDVTCLSPAEKTLRINTSSGNVVLDEVSAAEISINTKSGDVNFLKCHAGGSITVNTSSGDVEGELLGPYIFNVKTDSGDVSVPKSDNGVACTVSTGSGDVKILTSNAPAPSPTAAPTPEPTATPTPAGPELQIVHKIEDPGTDIPRIVVNTMVLYPDDAVVKVILRCDKPSAELHNGSTLGGIGFESETPDSEYPFILTQMMSEGEEMYVEFELGKLLDDAAARGAKKLMFIVDKNSGFSLVGVDIEYYR